jgi:hypothetical protein
MRHVHPRRLDVCAPLVGKQFAMQSAHMRHFLHKHITQAADETQGATMATGQSPVHTPRAPKKEDAWDFFRNTTQPRYEKSPAVSPNSRAPVRATRKLAPGEKGGHLYSIWGTPLSQLGDFGLGTGLYFHMVITVCAMMFIAGIINTPTINHFRYGPSLLTLL